MGSLGSCHPELLPHAGFAPTPHASPAQLACINCCIDSYWGLAYKDRSPPIRLVSVR